MKVGQIGNCKTNTLAEIWNSPAQMKLRIDMLTETDNPACGRCYEQEQSGFFSGRKSANKHHGHHIDRVCATDHSGHTEQFEMTHWILRFSNLCNLSCRSCGHIFSSSWYKDQTVLAGPAWASQNKPLNHAGHFATDMWEQLIDHIDHVEQIYFAGGEPLMSGETRKLIDWFKENQGRSQTRLAINSNLGMDRDKLHEFVERVRDIPHLEIYTSCEATGSAAEYIRDGLDYDLWMHNVQELLEHEHIRAVHVMCTINALCLETLPEFLTQLVKLKKVYGTQRVNFTLNILHFPSFQSPLVLSPSLLLAARNQLIMWEESVSNRSACQEFELNHVRRLIDYLKIVRTLHSDTFDMPKLHNDFRQFFDQYDIQRNKNFNSTFPNLKEWYHTL